MTAYVAHHEKKNRIFAKRERELIHAIKSGFSEEKLSLAAEKVREAKMGVFKCLFAKSTVRQPHAFPPDELVATNKQVQKWLSIATSEIIEMYRKDAAALPTVDSTARQAGARSEEN